MLIKPRKEGPTLNAHMLVISAESAGFEAGNQATIKMNNVKINMHANEYNHYRGLHVVIINPSNFRIEYAKVFDTYKDSTLFDVFCTRGV